MLAPLGWHLQLFAGGATLRSLEPALARCKVDVVVDHMGLPDAAAGTEQAAFQCLLRLLKTGHVWVKLAGADRITRASGVDVAELLQVLAEAVPERQKRDAILAGNAARLYGFPLLNEAHS
jgi:predicted TIM-barrel fold metal-dependent hydrolase